MVISYSCKFDGENGARGIVLNPEHIFATNLHNGKPGIYIVIERESHPRVVLSFNREENRDKVFENIQEQICTQAHIKVPKINTAIIKEDNEAANIIKKIFKITNHPNPKMTVEFVMATLNNELPEHAKIKHHVVLGRILGEIYGKDNIRKHKNGTYGSLYYNLEFTEEYITSKQ
jgi:hypothetical protein